MILYEGKPEEVGLLIAAIILLGVGVMPLIGVTIGMLRIMYGEYLVENARLLTKCDTDLRRTSTRTSCISKP